MTLEQWAWVADVPVVTDTNGSTHVVSRTHHTYHPLLWHLDDYIVSGVTADHHVNLVPRPKRGK